MKIICSKEDLSQGVQTIQSALSTRTTLPILLNFLMETEKQKIKVISTDLEMGVKHYIAAEVENEGDITIPAKKFFDILQSLPDNQDIELGADIHGKISLKCGRSRFSITGTPKSEYPILPTFDKQNAFSAPIIVIAEMIKKTIFAASSDETRHMLNGVFWSAKKGVLEMVATDGRRLAVISKQIVPKDKDFQVIVPTKALAELIRLLGVIGIAPDAEENIQISVTENQIIFQIKETTLLSRLVGGTFPNYEQVIPQKKDIKVSILIKDLIAVTKRAALCAIDRGGAVKYSLKKGLIHVSASSPTLEFNDELPIDYAGTDFTIAFDPRFVIDALKHIDSDRVLIGFTTPVNPALFEPENNGDYKFVIMPMRG